MHALHKKLREKREFYYEPRHVVGAALGLLIFGAGMFYSGMVIGKRSGDGAESAQAASAENFDARTGLASETRSPISTNRQPVMEEVAELEKAEPNLVHVAELGAPIPAKLPRASKSSRPVIRARGLVPAKTQKAVDASPGIALKDLNRVAALSTGATNAAVEETGTRTASTSAGAMGLMMSDAYREVYAGEPSVVEPGPMNAASVGAPSLGVRLVANPGQRRSRINRNKSRKDEAMRAFTIQIHAFKSLGTAKEVATAIGNFQGHQTLVKKQVRGDSEWYRVQIGSFPNLRVARSYQQAFEAQKGLANTFLVSM